MGSGFSDEGHLQYYQDKKKGKPVVLTAKNKLKLLKRVSKGMSLFDELGFALDPNQRALLNDLQTNLTSVIHFHDNLNFRMLCVVNCSLIGK